MVLGDGFEMVLGRDGFWLGEFVGLVLKRKAQKISKIFSQKAF